MNWWREGERVLINSIKQYISIQQYLAVILAVFSSNSSRQYLAVILAVFISNSSRQYLSVILAGTVILAGSIYQ